MKRYILAYLLFLITMSAFSQSFPDGYTPEPIAYVIDAKGEETELAPGGDFSGEAPVKLKLSANAEDIENFSLVVVWTFTREGETEPYLTRYDADVDIDITTSGATIVQPKIIYTSMANSEIFWEFGADTYEPFSIVLAESSLEVPNAFSPNGDGVNDYFNVYNAKSLVSFSAAIFNRWGQKLYSWGLDEIDCESCGWDGTYNGKPVKAGVYYVVVKAVGADGIEYEYRKDVNLLRGYNEELGR